MKQPPEHFERGARDLDVQAALSLSYDVAAIAVIIALSVLVTSGGTGAARVLLSLAFLLFVPGRAVVTNWTAVRARPNVALCVVLSISILCILSVVTLFAHLWHPMALFTLEAALCFGAISFSIGKDLLASGASNQTETR